MKYTANNILDALRHVLDPDIKKDLVTLNMISNIEVADDSVKFKLTLTTPACPLKEKIKNDCIEAIHKHVNADLRISIELDSNVTSRRSENVNILPSVKNIICVASGKGGVGKSTVAVNLALSLAAKGASVGLIDADIHGPSVPIMLGVKGRKPEVRLIKDKHYILPLEAEGIKILSIGLLVDERQAVVWRGPMVTSALRQFVTDCIWGKLDYMIVDMPPGTGDVHITVAQTLHLTGAVIVTTPQEVALSDARKALAMFRLDSIKVPVLGVVENMAYFTPEELPGNRYYIFGKDGGRRLAEEYEVPFLGQIPIVQGIREGGDTGKPASVYGRGNKIVADAFDAIASNVAQQVAIKNANLQAQNSETVIYMTLVRSKLLLKKVEDSLDTMRPYLNDDGGNVEVMEITSDMIVRVKLVGACSTCPQSFMTMKAGIEEAVRRAVPEIKGVEAVNINQP